MKDIENPLLVKYNFGLFYFSKLKRIGITEERHTIKTPNMSLNVITNWLNNVAQTPKCVS